MAPMLSLWLAGIGCIMGCEGVLGSAIQPGTSGIQPPAHSTNDVVSGDACASDSSHHCCKKRTSKAEPQTERHSSATTVRPMTDRSSSEVGGRCPLAVSRAVVLAKKLQAKDLDTSPAFGQSIIPANGFLEQTTSLSKPPRLPNRGHTYLRCCVFLI
ncbi:MAG: hypothetical protein ACREBC_20580 [Pyrinomonadaceae bacterium]